MLDEATVNNTSIRNEESSETGEDAVQYVIFSLEDEEYGIPVDFVQEIILKQDITRIPKTLPYVAGMINLRGHIVPVMDSKKLFNISSAQKFLLEEKIMLLDLEKETVGLIVDKVNDVIYIKTSQIDPPPPNANVKTEYIQGVGKYDNRLLVLLNPESFYKDV